MSEQPTTYRFEPTGEVRQAQPGEWFERNDNVYLNGPHEHPTHGEFPIYRRVLHTDTACEVACKLAFADMYRAAFEYLYQTDDSTRKEVKRLTDQYLVGPHSYQLADELLALTERMTTTTKGAE